MKPDSPTPSIDLKMAAFKALLQGPQVFSQFSDRFSISEKDMQDWLDDASANLALAAGQDPGGKRVKNPRQPLLCEEERRALLGPNTH